MKMSNERENEKHRMLRIAVLSCVVFCIAAVFCGSGAAAETSWSAAYAGLSATGSDVEYTISTNSDLALVAKGVAYGSSGSTATDMKRNVTYDFGDVSRTLTGTDSTASIGFGLLGAVDLNGYVLTIKNLNISTADIQATGSSSYSGLIVGYLISNDASKTGKFVLENCKVNGGIISSSSYNVGGLVGGAYSASGQGMMEIEISNCDVCDCYLSSSSSSVGGLVGDAYSASGKIVKIAMNGCNVERCALSSSYNVGGLVGYANAASEIEARDCDVCDCYLSSSSSYVGGLVGAAYSASKKIDLGSGCKVENCVLKSGSRVGGAIGNCGISTGNVRNIGLVEVKNCVIYSTSTNKNAGGVFGSCDKQPVSVTSCTVDSCTIYAPGTSAKAGGIAAVFPTAGTMSGNTVKNTCVVSEGNAAGICPSALS